MMNSQQIKTLFIGSGVFAVEILKGLVSSSSVELVGVITQPDKPAGRKKILTPCPVAEYAESVLKTSEVEIFKPVKLREAADLIINKTKPDLVIVADYGQIIPDVIINFPKYKCLNVHGSLLPDLRGAVPIPMAILKGYKETGVSIPIMTPKLDDGDIVASQREPIKLDDTTETLKARLAKIGADLLIKIIPDWVAGKIVPLQQDESKATYCWQKDIAKEKAQIKPDMTAEGVDRMVRAFYPWPIAWGNFNNGSKTYRIQILETGKGNGEIQLQDGTIKVNKIQREGGNITNDCSLLKSVKLQYI